MEFLILIIAMIIGVAIGWQLRELHAMRQVHKLLASHELQIHRDEQDVDRTKMRLEQHGEAIYAFEEETDTFIAQGKTLEDLDTAIQVRFPGKKFSVREANLHEVASNESV